MRVALANQEDPREPERAATPPRLRELKKSRTRTAIQQAALRLFAERGYAATTCEQIAAAAEVSPATFFRYFPTKEDVLFVDDYDAMFMSLLASRPPEEPPIRAVRAAIAEGLAAILGEDEPVIRDRMRMALSVPALRARMYEEQEVIVSLLAETLAPRMRAPAGGVRARVIAATLAAAVRVAAEKWAQEGGDLPVLFSETLSLIEEEFGTASRR